MRSLGIAAALAAMSQGMGNGVDVLTSMFTPRFHVGGDGNPRSKHRAKHRNSGSGSKRLPWHNSDTGCGAKQCRKYALQVFSPIHRNFDARMAWNERNAHVLAKRAEDQARAAGPLGGKNATVWGRR